MLADASLQRPLSCLWPGQKFLGDWLYWFPKVFWISHKKEKRISQNCSSEFLLNFENYTWKVWWISMVVLVESFNKKLLSKRLWKHSFNKLTLGCHPTIPIFPQNIKKSLSSSSAMRSSWVVCQRLGGSFALMRPINDKEAIIPINRLFSQWSEVTKKGWWIWRNFIFQEANPNWTKLMKMVYTKEKYGYTAFHIVFTENKCKTTSQKNWHNVWMNFDTSFRAPSSTVDP